MPDLRYHVVSLIAVFLALAVGVLLGTAMADRGVISDQVQAEVTNIQQQLDEQRELIAEKDAQIAEQQQLLGDMSETMISERLQGVNVALVRGPWADGEVFQDLQSDLTAAGADLVSIEELPAPQPAATPEQALEEIGTAYADTAQQVLGTTGEPEVPEVVVFVGGGSPQGENPGENQGENRSETIEAVRTAQRTMFEFWLEAGIRVVGAESSEVRRSEVPLFKEAGIPSVDYVDQAAGRAGVVQLASGVADGSYGVKNSASDTFPPAPS